MPEVYQGVAVVGGGAAGLMAAMYAARAGCVTRLYEGDPFDGYDPPGGQLIFAERAHFVPGFPDGIDGPVLMAALRDQVERLGVEIVTSPITAIARDGDLFDLTADGTSVHAPAVVLATGARRRLPDVGEARLLGRGVSFCAMCDAPLYAQREVVVLGGGDTAADEAITLARQALRVRVLHRGERLDAHPGLVAEMTELPNVEVIVGAELVAVRGDQVVTEMTYRSRDAVLTSLPIQGLFIAIGRIPSSDLVTGQVAMDAAGYVRVDSTGTTSAPGLFACGEVADRDFRQFATAVGSGSRAGMSAARWLLSRGADPQRQATRSSMSPG